MFIISVYIPPTDNAKETLRELQNSNPNGLFVGRRFQPCKSQSVLPKFQQYVDFLMRVANTGSSSLQPEAVIDCRGV